MNKLISNPFVIAIDGVAASGKGTIAKKLAEHFQIPCLDTGILYRAVGYQVLKNNQFDDEALVSFCYNLKPEDFENPLLATEEVGRFASIVASHESVRGALLDYQRNFPAGKKAVILDGRDIGTFVFPNADCKFFITAKPEVRAERRYKQLRNQGRQVIYGAVLKDLEERDHRDQSRTLAPLKCAEDANYIDTTDLSVDEVFSICKSLIDKAMKQKNIA